MNWWKESTKGNTLQYVYQNILVCGLFFVLLNNIEKDNLKSSNPQLPSRNDIELKEKRVDAEKDDQSGGNRHKGA